MEKRFQSKNSTLGGIIIPPESTNGGGIFYKVESKPDPKFDLSATFVHSSDTKPFYILQSDLKIKIQLNSLIRYHLKSSLDILIENDDGGYIARTIDFPLYSYSDELWEAIDGIKYEIESLYEDLMEGKEEEFTKEWLYYKKLLTRKILE